MRCLKGAKLHLNFKKCEFFRTKTKYLGHIITGTTIEVDPARLETLRCIAKPLTLTELRVLLGMVNFCKEFIPDLTKILTPLKDLTQGKKKKIPCRMEPKSRRGIS
eukprot:GHVP01020765.1.p3 GENE.GHVP01020765.1~~GHVP01020765.1.p3  ORF type:complete len:106 (+),score=3.62 GHVP01020765.1:322-639(+)